ncbi:hypothetical protein [Pseudomonas sp. 58 R 3]|nr:hypothetical protein [Pseudomonas sp. 58 R 3]
MGQLVGPRVKVLVTQSLLALAHRQRVGQRQRAGLDQGVNGLAARVIPGAAIETRHLAGTLIVGHDRQRLHGCGMALFQGVNQRVQRGEQIAEDAR